MKQLNPCLISACKSLAIGLLGMTALGITGAHAGESEDKVSVLERGAYLVNSSGCNDVTVHGINTGFPA